MAARRAGPAAFPARRGPPTQLPFSLRSGPIVKAEVRTDPDRSSARPRKLPMVPAEPSSAPASGRSYEGSAVAAAFGRSEGGTNKKTPRPFPGAGFSLPEDFLGHRIVFTPHPGQASPARLY